MPKMRKLPLLASVAFSVLATPTFAQETTPASSATQPSPGTGRSAAQAPAPDAIAMREIVVTAQRREERAQDVPISISAFSTERLEQMNVRQPQDLYGAVPSLVVGTQGNASRDVQSYSIRGQSTGFLSSPAVALYMNEVPLPSAVTLNLQGAPGLMIDLENIQVLSGPQGTLFGRNTTGGAVLFVPRKPTNDLEGHVEGSIGNYDLRAVEGVLNVPLVDDKLLVRVVGAYQDREGYTRDLVWNKDRDDVHWYSGRIGITLRPTERIENYLMAYGAKSSNNGAGHIHKAFNIAGLQGVGFCADPPASPVPGLGVSCDVYRRQTELAQEGGPRKTRHSADGFSKISTWGVTNTTSFDLTDELTLRNIISFQKLKDNYATDQDGTPLQQYELNQNAKNPAGPVPGLAEFGLPLFGYINAREDLTLPRDYLKQFTEEIQVQGNMLEDRLTFTAGFFHFNAKPASQWDSAAVNYCPALFTGACTYGLSSSGVSNRSNALYAQGTLDLGAFAPSLEDLRLTAGYRYTWDTIRGFNRRWDPDVLTGTADCLLGGLTPGTVPLQDVERCTYRATLKSKAPTWNFGLDYKPIDRLMVYAKVSRGYKAGGFNTVSVRPETQTFDPEKLTTYETGFKSDWYLGDMPARLNVTYYYSDYKNIHRPTGDYNPLTGAAGAKIASASASIQGFEAEAMVRPTPWLEIGGSVSHTDADYKEFQEVVFAPTQACNGFVAPGGVADFTCMPFQFVTPWIYNINATVTLPVAERLGDVSLYVSYAHVSKQATSPLSNAELEPGSVLEGYGLLNASLSWNGIGGSSVDASVFANNITNKLYRVSNSNTFNDLLAWTALYGEPRMYGVKLRYRFGG